MGGIAISSAGIKVMYAVETTAGTMPTSGAKVIPDIKEIPDFNVEPEKLETTTLENTEYKTFIPGLKDLSNASGYGANFTQTLLDFWDELYEAFETAKADNKKVWFFIVVPGWTKCCAFTGEPSKMGLPGVGTNAVFETTAYITPTGEPKWVTTIPTEE